MANVNLSTEELGTIRALLHEESDRLARWLDQGKDDNGRALREWRVAVLREDRAEIIALSRRIGRIHENALDQEGVEG